MNRVLGSDTIPPIISQFFDRNLLSTPVFKYGADCLLKIAQWLEKKMLSAEFRKFPDTVGKLIVKQQQFMELYERAKIEEGKSEEKKNRKVDWPFYRPELTYENGRRLFRRLEHRMDTYSVDKRKNKIQKT